MSCPFASRRLCTQPLSLTNIRLYRLLSGPATSSQLPLQCSVSQIDVGDMFQSNLTFLLAFTQPPCFTRLSSAFVVQIAYPVSVCMNGLMSMCYMCVCVAVWTRALHSVSSLTQNLKMGAHSHIDIHTLYTHTVFYQNVLVEIFLTIMWCEKQVLSLQRR